mgnify:FL=1
MHMWWPDVIGREVWDWVGRESEGWLAMNSPLKGEEALTEVSPLTG